MQVQSSLKRLKKHHEFVKVERRGCRATSVLMALVVYADTKSPNGRAGFSVSKKIGKAHDRNFIKRRLRHLVYKHRHLIASLQIVLIARHTDLGVKDFAFIEEDFLYLLDKAKRQLHNRRQRK